MGEAEEPVAEATTEMGEAEEPVAEATTETVEEPVAEATTEMGETTGEMAAADVSAAKASALIGHAVQDLQGEDIGEIEDLVIGLDSDQVRYAVLSFGGFLDIGDKLFAIPVEAFQFDHEQNVFLLDVTEEQLESAPGFDANNWPDTASPDWDADLRSFWTDDMMGADEGDVAEGAQDDTAQPGEDVAQTEEDQDTTQSDAFVGESAVRASEILDYTVENAQGEAIGEVEDIIVELDTGMVQHVVLEFDDEIDNSEDYVGLQLSQLNFTPENDAFLLEDQSLIQGAPTFNPEEWDNQFNLELGQVTQ
jgi:sporulation protein YlmC with PRC-barrel domain